MNVRRSTLRRRKLLQAGSVAALGAVSTILAGRKILSVSSPRSSAPSPSPLAAEAPEPVLVRPAIDPPVVDEGPAPELVGPPLPPLEYEAEYADFLRSLELRHLSPEEIINPHRSMENGIANSLPPREKWERLAPTLRVADEIRERLNVPIARITSAYRCPRYNAQIPGAARGSYHCRNQALDIVFWCPVRQAYDMARQLRREGMFRGGIGVYPTFIHLDTRGYTATWRG